MVAHCVGAVCASHRVCVCEQGFLLSRCLMEMTQLRLDYGCTEVVTGPLVLRCSTSLQNAVDR